MPVDNVVRAGNFSLREVPELASVQGPNTLNVIPAISHGGSDISAPITCAGASAVLVMNDIVLGTGLRYVHQANVLSQTTIKTR